MDPNHRRSHDDRCPDNRCTHDCWPHSGQTWARHCTSDDCGGDEWSEESGRYSAGAPKHQRFLTPRLIEQLRYDRFSLADATYAVDRIGADRDEEAAQSAQSYLDTMPVSRQGHIDQLIYEKFTPAQAAYGVSTTGL